MKPLQTSLSGNENDGYARLLAQSGVVLLVCALLVNVCYFYVDRPVAFFVHDQDFRRFEILRQFTYIPEIVPAWSPLVLVLLAIHRAWGPWRRCEWVLLAAIVSLMVAEQFRESLKFLFGRYWPETWLSGGNPSLIRDNAYGFHPFHNEAEYGSFPSGHTARSVAAATVFWITYPGWRWLCVLVPATIVIGLIGNNYHFVGDVVAGGFVGGIVGMYAGRLFRLG